MRILDACELHHIKNSRILVDDFLMSAEPHGDFWKIIWVSRKNSIVTDIALYRGTLYQGSSVLALSHNRDRGLGLAGPTHSAVGLWSTCGWRKGAVRQYETQKRPGLALFCQEGSGYQNQTIMFLCLIKLLHKIHTVVFLRL